MKRSKLARYLAPLAALGAAAVTAAGMMLVPVDLLERAVDASGLADWFPPAALPLGDKARALLAFGAAALAAMTAFGAALLLDWHQRRQRRTTRAPLSMVELGLLAPAEVEDVQAAAPAEIEDMETAAPAEVEEIELVASAEFEDVVSVAPVQPAEAAAPPEPVSSGNIASLVDRFEQGLTRRRAAARPTPPEPANVDEALGDVLSQLRRLAVQR